MKLLAMKVIIFIAIICIVLAFNSFTSAFVKYHRITPIPWPKKYFLDQDKEENFTSQFDSLKEQYNYLFQNLCQR